MTIAETGTHTRATDYAERQALGVVLEHPDLAARLFARVQVADFTGSCQLVAEAIHGMRVERKPFDLILIGGEMTRRGTLNRAGGLGFLHELVREFPNHTLLDGYADEIVYNVRRRKVWQAATRAAARAESPEQDPVALARAVVDEMTAVIDHAESDAEVVVPTLAEFLDAEDAPFDWVLPGLLERGDRAIITGSEGLGKSVLMRQLAICAAGGLNPFLHTFQPPVEVLHVDLENTPTQSRRRYRGLAAQAKRLGRSADQRLRIECRPEGLDLTRPTDEGWLVRAVSTLQPALLVIGPVYRLHNDDPNKEEPARAVTRVLDRCRSAANCAVLLEGHSPHGDAKAGPRPVRPVGSSLWLRWPEFGYGLRKVEPFDPAHRRVDLVAWRGDRDERVWPKHLSTGGTFPWRIDNNRETPNRKATP